MLIATYSKAAILFCQLYIRTGNCIKNGIELYCRELKIIVSFICNLVVFNVRNPQIQVWNCGIQWFIPYDYAKQRIFRVFYISVWRQMGLCPLYCPMSWPHRSAFTWVLLLFTLFKNVADRFHQKCHQNDVIMTTKTSP